MCSDTRLADYTAELAKAQQADPTSTESATPATSKGSSIPTPIVSSRSTKTASPAPAEPPNLAQLRLDLSTAQSARSTLSAQNVELNAQLEAMRKERDEAQKEQSRSKALAAASSRKVKDRDSELTEKRKMLERVQDEMVGQEMQLNVAEQEKAKLKAENEDLVKRLVKESEASIASRVRDHS